MERHPEILILGEFGIEAGVLTTHDAAECALPYCAIHNPSTHRLRDAPLRWRSDLGLLERVCEHGNGHPDPDSLDYIFVTDGARRASYLSVHTCDGCCPPD